MLKPIKTLALGAALLIAVAVGTLQNVSQMPAAAPRPQSPAATLTPRPAQDVTATPPFSIDPAMLSAIQSLPADLMETIATNTRGRTEIVAAQHTGKVPLEQTAASIEEVWCIHIYPAAVMTLYVQRYVARKDAIFVSGDDYVPGESGSGLIDHFLAARRGEVWELYHPEVYSWNALGC